MTSSSPGPLVVRPRKLLLVARGAAALVAVSFLAIAFALRTGEGGMTFKLGDQVAMAVLGLLLAGAVLLLTRARVEADTTGIWVRNVFGAKAVPWQVVRGIVLLDGSPWASLELHDDDRIALMAIQANDGKRAVDAVLALRRLLASSQQR